jgi:hypothetical protein
VKTATSFIKRYVHLMSKRMVNANHRKFKL